MESKPDKGNFNLSDDESEFQGFSNSEWINLIALAFGEDGHVTNSESGLQGHDEGGEQEASKEAFKSTTETGPEPGIETLSNDASAFQGLTNEEWIDLIILAFGDDQDGNLASETTSSGEEQGGASADLEGDLGTEQSCPGSSSKAIKETTHGSIKVGAQMEVVEENVSAEMVNDDAAKVATAEKSVSGLGSPAHSSVGNVSSLGMASGFVASGGNVKQDPRAENAVANLNDSHSGDKSQPLGASCLPPQPNPSSTSAEERVTWHDQRWPHRTVSGLARRELNAPQNKYPCICQKCGGIGGHTSKDCDALPDEKKWYKFSLDIDSAFPNFYSNRIRKEKKFYESKGRTYKNPYESGHHFSPEEIEARVEVIRQRLENVLMSLPPNRGNDRQTLESVVDFRTQILREHSFNVRLWEELFESLLDFIMSFRN